MVRNDHQVYWPGVRKFKVGDEVYGCVGGFIGTPGALAEYVTVDESLVAHKPKSLGFADGRS